MEGRRHHGRHIAAALLRLRNPCVCWHETDDDFLVAGPGNGKMQPIRKWVVPEEQEAKILEILGVDCSEYEQVLMQVIQEYAATIKTAGATSASVTAPGAGGAIVVAADKEP